MTRPFFKLIPIAILLAILPSACITTRDSGPPENRPGSSAWHQKVENKLRLADNRLGGRQFLSVEWLQAVDEKTGASSSGAKPLTVGSDKWSEAVDRKLFGAGGS